MHPSVDVRVRGRGKQGQKPSPDLLLLPSPTSLKVLTWGRFPARLPVPAYSPPCRPSVIWLLWYLSPRDETKPLREQRCARDMRLGTLARRSRWRDSRVDTHQEWGHFPRLENSSPGVGCRSPGTCPDQGWGDARTGVPRQARNAFGS